MRRDLPARIDLREHVVAGDPVRQRYPSPFQDGELLLPVPEELRIVREHEIRQLVHVIEPVHGPAIEAA